MSQDGTIPSEIPREFVERYEQERTRVLRKRMAWYCFLAGCVMVLSITGGVTSLWSGDLPLEAVRPTRIELAIDVPEWGYSSIALDSAMNPHVVLAAGDQIVHFSKPGDEWENEVVIDTSMIPDVNMDQIALAIGPDDSLHMLGGASIAGVLEVPFYIYPNGEGWAIYLLEAKNAGFYPVITPDHGGIMHATYSASLRRDTSSLRYVALPLANLSGEWVGVSITENHGKLTLNATIEVQNTGADASAKTNIAIYLSQDDVLSGDDEPLNAAPSLKAVKPGVSTLVRVKSRLPDAVMPNFLIAHLDPGDMVADSNATNNIIVTPLPP